MMRAIAVRATDEGTAITPAIAASNRKTGLPNSPVWAACGSDPVLSTSQRVLSTSSAYANGIQQQNSPDTMSCSGDGGSPFYRRLLIERTGLSGSNSIGGTLNASNLPILPLTAAVFGAKGIHGRI
ncbi:MAG TPA: hypothetical protein VG142_16450 [Trebonia sp.]|jgi:hypothetical protein|nr:hypothetical protein [Trebonia sp.]